MLDVRRAGRWNRDEMISCYLTSHPFKCIKAMSGLSPKGDFYIARAQITPPLQLQKKIFLGVTTGYQGTMDKLKLNQP
ncbi:hypothetical protein V1525DRAFT_409070 [Lipomyces kononenkoae]|uniref:Uncharacterized protein n=1 Tax=Lipomyces kononenkoae TaxID=34357 RepID=A0ACC3SVV0_LIPKO